MKSRRTLAVALLLGAILWAGSGHVRADEPDCWYSDGPMGGWWCQNNSYDCGSYVYDCCGEDFKGDCGLDDCNLILPAPYGACCDGLGVWCNRY